jgi:alpha-tubulin suppressor-like RCC1 family protein
MKFHKIDAKGSIQIQRLTTAERISIVNPSEGRLAWDTTENKAYVGNGSIWVELGSGGGGGGGTAEMQIDQIVTGTPSGSYTGGDTTYELTSFTYTAGNSELLVFSNNLLMKLGVDWNEDVGGAQIDFTSPRAASEDVCIIKIADSGAGGGDFLSLADTPGSYAGQAGKVPVVNLGETALEFAAGTGIEIVPTLPVWMVSDEGRVVYADDVNLLYYGDNTQWRQVATGGVVLEREEFLGAAGASGNTVFTLASITYTPGIEELLVFSNSVLMREGVGLPDDYEETGASEITFHTARAAAERIDVIKVNPAPAGGSITEFTGLSDTPNSYAGEALKVVRVNAGETATEFVTITEGGDLATVLALGNSTGANDIIITGGQAIISAGGSNADVNITPDGTGDINLNKDTVITGKLTVTGLIDPTGLELDPVAGNPGGVAANTLWLDSANSDKLKHGDNEIRPLIATNLHFGDGGLIPPGPDFECLVFGDDDDSVIYYDGGTNKLVIDVSGDGGSNATGLTINGDVNVTGTLSASVTAGGNIAKFAEYQGGRCSPASLRTIAYITKDKRVMVVGDNSNIRFGAGISTVYGANGFEIPLPDPEIPSKVYMHWHTGLQILCESGNVYGTGRDSEGQLSAGTFPGPVGQPALCTVTNVKKIAHSTYAGLTHYYLTNAGELYAAGANAKGQIGDGTTNNTDGGGALLVLGPGNGFGNPTTTVDDIICAGTNADITAMALLSDGTVRMIGDGTEGQMGDGSTNDINTSWIDPGLTNIVDIQCTGVSDDTTFFALTGTGTLHGWGYNGRGTLATGNTTNQTTPFAMSADVSDFWTGSSFHSLFIKQISDSRIYAVGYNNTGQLGINSGTGTITSFTNCVELNSEDVAEILIAGNDAGEWGTVMAYTTDGKLFGTGRNAQWQLSLGHQIANILVFTLCKCSFNNSGVPVSIKSGLDRDTPLIAPNYINTVGGHLWVISEDGHMYFSGWNRLHENGGNNFQTHTPYLTKIQSYA